MECKNIFEMSDGLYDLLQEEVSSFQLGMQK